MANNFFTKNETFISREGSNCLYVWNGNHYVRKIFLLMEVLFSSEDFSGKGVIR